MIHDVCASKVWTPFKLRAGKVEISHLLFADDVILFGEANLSTLSSSKFVLGSFFEMSGQKVNEDKSSSNQGCVG